MEKTNRFAKFVHVGDDKMVPSGSQAKAIESEEGFRRRRAEDPPREVSTVTTNVVPTPEEEITMGKDAAATAVRFVGPVAAGLFTGGMGTVPALLAQAGGTAASEFVARRLERIGTDPEFDTLWQDAQAAGTAGALDIGVGFGLAGVSRLTQAAMRKAIMPKVVPDEVLTAQTVFGRLSETAKPTMKKWHEWSGKSYPYTLTPGQLNYEEGGLFRNLEKIALGASGEKKMKAFYKRNSTVAADALEEAIVQGADSKSAVEVGTYLRRLLGDVDDPINAIKPIEVYRAALYDTFTDTLEGTVDLSRVQKMLKASRGGPYAKIYRALNVANADGSVPLPPIKTGDWSKIKKEDADRVLRNFGQFYKGDSTLSYAATQVKDVFAGEFRKGLTQFQTDLLDAAKEYYSTEKNVLANSAMKGIRRVINNNPEALSALLDPTKGNAAVKYGKLMRIKSSLYLSAAAPRNGVVDTKLGKELAKQYDNEILHPLRFNFLDACTNKQGILEGSKVLSQIKKISGENNNKAPEMLTELFGSKEQVDKIKQLATALDVNAKSQPNASIFIQLKTASALGAAGGAAYSFFNGDNPVSGSASGAAALALPILVAPRMLANVLTSRTLTNSLIKGIETSNKYRGISPVLALTFRKAAQQYPVSKMFRENSHANSNRFYTIQVKQQEQAQ